MQHGFVTFAFERDNAQGPVLSVKLIDGRHSVRQAIVDLRNTGKNQVNRRKLGKFESLGLGVGDHDPAGLGQGSVAGGSHGVGFEGVVVHHTELGLLEPSVKACFGHKKLQLSGLGPYCLQIINDLVGASAVQK